jgi:pyruvate dehydrogenase E2 component (dihydrolipoamide acetyltransferase)
VSETVGETAKTIAPITGKVRATPAARRLAAHNAIDLTEITGTGPRGRVQRSDLEARLETPASPPVSEGQSWSAQSGSLSVVSSGKGEAMPWVMIHGFAADASGWTPLEKQLAKSAPVHRIELPNHGRSPRRRIEGFSDLTSQIRQAFDDIGVDNVRLVGHSLGAAVALALTDTRPRKVASLTLISPAGLGPDINAAALSGIARASKPQSLGPWLKQLTGDPDLVSDNYIRAAFAQRRDPQLRAAQQDMMEALFPDGVQTFDVKAALKRISCPTRIIWGRSDSIIPWKHALGVPGSVSLNLFHGIGHLPHVEIPDEIGALLMQ